MYWHNEVNKLPSQPKKTKEMSRLENCAMAVDEIREILQIALESEAQSNEAIRARTLGLIEYVLDSVDSPVKKQLTAKRIKYLIEREDYVEKEG